MKRNPLYAIVFLALIQANTASSQTVQLPAMRQFSTSGSVLVPDRGSAYLGGNQSSATMSASRGLPGVGRLPGSIYRSSRSSSSGVSVHATIIDLDEMDRQILGYDPHEARRARQRGTTVVTAETEITEAKSLVRNARRAVSEGQRGTARSIYALAIEKLSRHEEAAELLVYAQAEVARVLGGETAAGHRTRRATPPERNATARLSQVQP